MDINLNWSNVIFNLFDKLPNSMREDLRNYKLTLHAWPCGAKLVFRLSSLSCSFPPVVPVVLSELPCHDYEELSKLQEEATYELVDQPRPPTDYQLTNCAAYITTDFNTGN